MATGSTNLGHAMSHDKPSRKRNRKGKETHHSSSSPQPFSFSLNDLHDSLLIEILCRVASPNIAVFCKLVSKRWCSLISTSHFITRFINHHVNDRNQQYQKPSTILLSYLSLNNNIINNYNNSSNLISIRENKFKIIVPSNHSIFRSRGLININHYVCVVASCNDLLLLCNSNRNYITGLFYVLNPFTAQRFTLPMIPKLSNKLMNHINYGLVISPDDYRFRVLCVTTSRFGYQFHFNLHTYCSETRDWMESTLVGNEFKFSSNVVAYKGKLHWFNGDNNVVVFDPFNNEQTNCFIDCPRLVKQPTWLVHHCLGVNKDCLRIMQLAIYKRERINTLTTWILKDYKAGKWTQEHSLCLDKLFRNHSSFHDYYREEHLFPKLLACHPSDRNIVFMDYKNQVFSCNLRTQKLKLAAKTETGSFYDHNNVFQLILPWWPTQVSTLPQNQ